MSVCTCACVCVLGVIELLQNRVCARVCACVCACVCRCTWIHRVIELLQNRSHAPHMHHLHKITKHMYTRTYSQRMQLFLNSASTVSSRDMLAVYLVCMHACMHVCMYEIHILNPSGQHTCQSRKTQRSACACAHTHTHAHAPVLD